MRRRGNRTALLVGAAAIFLLSIAMAVEFAPRLVWNATPSAPIGLYLVKYKAPVIGDYMLVNASGDAKELIDEREYLPRDTPLLKRVAALSGAEICRENALIYVDGVHVAGALAVDSSGRDLPQWSGCITLQSDELFLLNDHQKSLDGRYFGATKAPQIVGVAQPLFVREQYE